MRRYFLEKVIEKRVDDNVRMFTVILIARNRHLMEVLLSQQILQDVAKLCRHFGHESHSKLWPYEICVQWPAYEVFMVF